MSLAGMSRRRATASLTGTCEAAESCTRKREGEAAGRSTTVYGRDNRGTTNGPSFTHLFHPSTLRKVIVSMPTLRVAIENALMSHTLPELEAVLADELKLNWFRDDSPKGSSYWKRELIQAYTPGWITPRQTSRGPVGLDLKQPEPVPGHEPESSKTALRCCVLLSCGDDTSLP